VSNVIKPTVGRKVWYRPSRSDLTGPLPMSMMGNPDYNPQPLDATVLAVHSDRLVNVLVLDVYGKPFSKTSVKLLQEGDETPKTVDGVEAYGYVEWMPYQAKAAAREPALDAAAAAHQHIAEFNASGQHPPEGWQGAERSKMSNDQKIEQEIVAKGLTAPRVTPGNIQSAITIESYFTAQDGVIGASIRKGTSASDSDRNPLNLLTFCVLVLRNGFTVTGESACASPENFDAEIGRKIARENAVNKIWLLEGYLLKQHLYDREQFAASQATGGQLGG
jgi:hypothetical protein